MLLYFPPFLSQNPETYRGFLKSHPEGLEGEQRVGSTDYADVKRGGQAPNFPCNEGMDLMGVSSEATAQLLT